MEVRGDDIPASQAAVAWRRFRRNKLAVAGLVIIILATLTALLGYLITPDDTPFANDQKPELHICPPGFTTRVLLVTRNTDEAAPGFFRRMIAGASSSHDSYPFSSYSFYRDRVIIEGSGTDGSIATRDTFNVADVVYALAPGTRISYDEDRDMISFTLYGSSSPTMATSASLRSFIEEDHIVTKRFLLGTDRLGRDLLSRLMIGTRISLAVGFISVLISLLIGISLGAVAGYFRGTVDAVIMWLINVVWSIPTLLLVIAITLVLGKGVTQVFIAVGLTMWVDVARVVRGQVLGIREREFVEAARSLGFSNFRIISKHILPNVMGPVFVMAAVNFATAILMEAGLSFLGLGAQPPVPSWGEMTAAHHGYILMDKAYLVFFPGGAIMILVLSFMMVGTGLRDALDTKTEVVR